MPPVLLSRRHEHLVPHETPPRGERGAGRQFAALEAVGHLVGRSGSIAERITAPRLPRRLRNCPPQLSLLW